MKLFMQNYYDDEYCNSYHSNSSSDSNTSSDEISDEISSGKIQRKMIRKISMKRKEAKEKDQNTVIKEKQKNEKSEIQTIKERKVYLDIHYYQYYHQPKANVARIKSTFSNAVRRKRKKIILYRDSILKDLRMGEFNSFIKEGQVYLKAFISRGKCKTVKSSYHRFLEDNTYNAALPYMSV